MANSNLHYNLSNGYLQNWLVAGPLVQPVSETDLLSPEPAARIAQTLSQRFEPDSGVTQPPVDVGPLGPVTKDNPLIVWQYYRCRDDHYVDFTTVCPAWSYLRAWAYAQLSVPAPREVRLVLTTYGPADVWLNGQHLHRQDQLDPARPRSVSIAATLGLGTNEILVRLESAGLGAVPCVLALQVQGLADGEAQVVLPTAIEPDLMDRRQVLEKIAAQATLDRYVYGYMDGDHLDQNEPMVVTFPSDLEAEGTLLLRLQSLQGDIFQERTTAVKPGLVVELAKKFPLRNGPHHLELRPLIEDYYVQQMRFERKELFYVARTPYTHKASPSAPARSQEALEDAAARRNNSVYCELAKMALGRWEQVDRKIVDRAVQGINQGQPGSMPDLLGLLGALLRFKKEGDHVRALGLNAGSFVTNYAHWRGDENRRSRLGDAHTGSESAQLLYLTCEVLAGQLFPDRAFTATGKKGRWHRDRAAELALACVRQHGRYGFRDWHSPGAVELTLAALSHLCDLATSDALREMASVLMDKVFFDLAVNSFQGAYGASKGLADTASLLSARLEPASGIARLMWGLGNLNENLIGTVSLACCRKYELPEVIRQMAISPVEAFWSRERHVTPVQAPEAAPPAASPWQSEAVTATYKTSDFMLSSAQDYRAGQPGLSEHIWQATLGPDALVFVNHPANTSEDDSRRPNLWAGNGVLPRVAQWGDVLVALYQLPDGDWLGFTHAYFPAAAFDETLITPNWAFARKGNGYLALMAARGLDFITTGHTAYRELRSHGRENIWLCHMGQALLDGAFNDFQTKILAMEVASADLSVVLKTLRGDSLAFAWDGPLTINGQPQPLDAARHIENPYCIADLPATQTDIVYQEQGLRLKFE